MTTAPNAQPIAPVPMDPRTAVSIGALLCCCKVVLPRQCSLLSLVMYESRACMLSVAALQWEGGGGCMITHPSAQHQIHSDPPVQRFENRSREERADCNTLQEGKSEKARTDHDVLLDLRALSTGESALWWSSAVCMHDQYVQLSLLSCTHTVYVC